MKKTGLNGYVCDFSVDYYAFEVDDILDVHKNNNEKEQYDIKMFGFIKKSVSSSNIIFQWNYTKSSSFKICFNE